MNLFKCSNRQSKSKINKEPLVCLSPFGKLYFHLAFDDKEIFSISPQEIYSCNNAIISSWRLEECEIEFFRADFMPKIPSQMKVDYCTAGIWRIKNFHSKLDVSFKTIIEIEKSLNEKDLIETGEGLFASSYENNEFKLSIGTEDEEYLASRASIQKWLPYRLEDIFLNSCAIDSIPGGLKVILPSIEANETVQIQFIIAWSSKKNNESSTWFAVDQSSDFVLKQFNVN